MTFAFAGNSKIRSISSAEAFQVAAQFNLIQSCFLTFNNAVSVELLAYSQPEYGNKFIISVVHADEKSNFFASSNFSVALQKFIEVAQQNNLEVGDFASSERTLLLTEKFNSKVIHVGNLTKANLSHMALVVALGTFLSDYDADPHTALNQLGEDESDEISVWEPFEKEPFSVVHNAVVDLRDHIVSAFSEYAQEG